MWSQVAELNLVLEDHLRPEWEWSLHTLFHRKGVEK